MALVTIRALPRNVVRVADVNILQSSLLGDIVCQAKCGWIRATAILHAKVRMKGSEVYWNVIAERVENPVAHFAQLARIVVGIRDDQVRDFEPNIGLTLQVNQRVENRLQME